MRDLYLDESGDIRASSSGDIAVARTPWRDDVQQAYIRLMTDQGDFELFPDLGASLSRLQGMPQSPRTGQEGEALIISALKRDGRFEGKGIDVKSVPVSPQRIRFDVTIISGSRRDLTLSIEQDLGLTEESD